MKTMLITGGTGFIGNFLVKEFINDYSIICLIRPDTKNLKRLRDISDRVEFITHDIRLSCDGIFDKLSKVNIILHAGGNPSSEDSLNNPLISIADNIISTAHLLEVARKLPIIDRFVYYSAGEVFGPISEGTDSYENDKYNCISPYAAAKASSEELCIAYSASYGVPISITHITNTFGEMSQPNRFPVIVIRKILNDEKLTIHTKGDGSQIGRRWFYASDVASHTRFILNNQKTICEKWNSSGSRFINNLEFAKLIATALNRNLRYELEPVSRVGQSYFSISPSKLYNLGWKEEISTEDKLIKTVNWYQNNRNWLTL